MHLLQSSALLSMVLASCAVAAPVDEQTSNVLTKRLENGQYNANSGGTYNGDEGTYINSDDVHHYASGVKCWTDYMLVSQEDGIDEPKQASNKYNCAEHANGKCQVGKSDGVETCESWSAEVSAGIAGEIFDFGVSAGHSLETCHNSQEDMTCEWADAGCHVVTSAQQVLIQKGYARRRCTDNGDYTAWLKDFEHRVPLKFSLINCDASC